MSSAEVAELAPAGPLCEYLDGLGLGSGAAKIEPIGDGHSNPTFAIERAGAHLVLRRPPRGPLAPSTHDVVREARMLRAVRAHGVPVAEVLAICEDEAVLGAPFYVMAFVAGFVLTATMPAPLAGAGEEIAERLVDALVALHELDPAAEELAGFGRADGYLERQLRRFGGLYETNPTRRLPDIEVVTEWLHANLPASPAPTVVHGDYRLGNVMFAPTPLRLAAILDWELATIGDPLADLGYMTAMWSEAGDPPNPVGDLSDVTRGKGFPGRELLARRYAERSGRPVDTLPWYQVLALWKAAVFLEVSFRRFGAGTTSDPFFAGLETGVPALAALARARAEST
ncbi:MAG TPA: phosphotransferase family protein [Solirubrobacterales bacterium]